MKVNTFLEYILATSTLGQKYTLSVLHRFELANFDLRHPEFPIKLITCGLVESRFWHKDFCVDH